MSRQAELVSPPGARAGGPTATDQVAGANRRDLGGGVARLLRASPSAHLGGRREGREYQAWTHVHPSWIRTRDQSVISAPPCSGNGRSTVRSGGANVPAVRGGT